MSRDVAGKWTVSCLMALGIFAWAGGAAQSASLERAADAPRRPNILYIMSDDHAAHAIGAYGSFLASLDPTPHIDRLAAQGMRFDRIYATNSICTPSRATILTGQYSHINGVPVFNAIDPRRAMVSKMLQQAGYYTLMLGKWHLGSDPQGFDDWEILPGQGVYNNPRALYPQRADEIRRPRHRHHHPAGDPLPRQPPQGQAVLRHGASQGPAPQLDPAAQDGRVLPRQDDPRGADPLRRLRHADRRHPPAEAVGGPRPQPRRSEAGPARRAWRATSWCAGSISATCTITWPASAASTRASASCWIISTATAWPTTRS